MAFQFVWRELTSAGLLKKAPVAGPHYALDDTLENGSWDTREQAVQALEDFVKELFLVDNNIILCYH